MIPHRCIAAFSLVEVTLALGISAFCLVTLVALLPTGIQSQQSASEESTCVNLAQGIFADLRASNVHGAAAATTQSVRYKLALPATGSQQIALYFDAVGNVLSSAADVAQKGRYQAVLTLLAPGTAASTSLAAVQAQLIIAWPAQAGSNAPNTISTSYDPTKPGTNDLRAKIGHKQGSVEMVSSFDSNP